MIHTRHFCLHYTWKCITDVLSKTHTSDAIICIMNRNFWQKNSDLMVLRGVIISELSLNQATLGWGLPPLERQVTLIMSPWLIDPDMSPCSWGSPGGSEDNVSYYSHFSTLTRWRDQKTQVRLWNSGVFWSLRSTQNNQISQLWSRLRGFNTGKWYMAAIEFAK